MKTILIIRGILTYLFVCFVFWAIVYVGTDGKMPVFRRRKQK